MAKHEANIPSNGNGAYADTPTSGDLDKDMSANNHSTSTGYTGTGEPATDYPTSGRPVTQGMNAHGVEQHIEETAADNEPKNVAHPAS